jgi:hypothetical protein
MHYYSFHNNEEIEDQSISIILSRLYLYLKLYIVLSPANNWEFNKPEGKENFISSVPKQEITEARMQFTGRAHSLHACKRAWVQSQAPKSPITIPNKQNEEISKQLNQRVNGVELMKCLCSHHINRRTHADSNKFC